MMEAISLEKAIGNIVLVDGISLSVKRGEIVGILGPGGAGKTTSFQMIAGILEPDRGRVLLDGLDITQLPVFERARRGLGFLPQEPSVIRGLTVEQNIMLALEVQDCNRDQRRAALDSLLELFGLTRLRKASAARLSGGERRRCEIARVFACGPSFILLDEPFAGIDPITVQDIRDLIVTLRDLGIGILITDHNAVELLASVERAYVIHAGRVLTCGCPAEIVDHAEVRRTYLGDAFSVPI
jgi:lipopolysaccharide export system ATP-binding protein